MKRELSYLLTLLCLAFFAVSCEKEPNGGDDGGETPPPSPSVITLAKKEMRAVWMATVWEIDWPQGLYSEAAQKKKYTDYLDKFVECNVNAVFVQIRPTADAFYNSSYESWSKSITGVAGKDPGYDVLAFMIAEAHARNLEFHAWMNPYRISTRSNASSAFPALDPKIPSELVKDYNTIRIYNPALPEVQDRLVSIVKDLISKYDVDGVHFDDYFYPDPASYTTPDDAAEYAKYGAGYTSVEAFRRGNVDKVIQKIYNTVVSEKPGVIFSISPTANNEYNYNSLYADVTKWCQEGWMDVVIPQIYVATGSTSSSFNNRVAWWPQFSYKAVPMVGYALYKFGDATAGALFQTTAELENQFKLAHAQSKIMGSVMYSATYFNSNPLGIINILKSQIYPNPAVRPFLGRKTAADPTPVSGVSLSGSILKWNTGNELRTVIYKLDANKKGSVVAITSAKEYTLPSRGTYCLTTVNKDNAESAVSEVITY